MKVNGREVRQESEMNGRKGKEGRHESEWKGRKTGK